MADTPAALQTGLAGSYTFERELGQGGMATVYLATDLKHHRKVAVKVLRPELAAVLGAERFLREIEVTAQLQHPHIIPLYDSGSVGGILYYVMPLIEGESLRDKLTREKKVPFEEAVRLTGEVASALAYAHERGLIHRDIKPENILLSGGHAVVADFGIARALTAAQQGSTAGLTGVGFAIGTPAYMSPEQATASDVDARSDQYSLAAVFYEMVSGTAPFAGQTVQAVLSKSLTAPRPKLSKVNREAPAEADGPVAKALASDPARRYDTVQAFAMSLEHAAGGGSGAVAERRKLKRLALGLPLAVAAVAAAWILFGPQRAGAVVAGAESIAVLPFSASGTGVETMSEGMVDLLSTNLNTVGGIKAVDPRLVLTVWKKAGGSGGADVATALNVARGVKATAALVGSIVATGPRVRISADLYGQDQKSLAHAQVDGASDSILALVDDLSLSLVREIWRSKEPVPSVRVGALTTNSLAAMREYLVGEQHYRRSEWDSAAAAFTRAIDQDSTFALAHFRFAATVGWSGGLGAADGLKASDAAQRFAGRLPPREKSLVQAYNLFEHRKLTATDSMKAYVARYPDDLDGWFLLGESQYHTRSLVGYDPATLRAPFDTVLARDSTLTPAAIHPLEIALAGADRPRYDAYFRVLAQAGNATEVLAYRGAGEMAFGSGIVDTATQRAMTRNNGTFQYLFSGFEVPQATSDSVMRRMDGMRRILAIVPTSRTNVYFARGLTLDGLGQFSAAREAYDSLNLTDPNNAYAILMWPTMVGIAPPNDSLPPELLGMAKMPRTSPFQVFLTVLMLDGRSRTAEASRLVDSMLTTDSTRMPLQLWSAYHAQKGWFRVQAGDTVGGLAQMRASLNDAGAGWNQFFTDPMVLRMATVMAARKDTRDQGIALLRFGLTSNSAVWPVALFAVAKAEEASGNRAAAANDYARFLKLWDKADPRVQGRVDEAKAGLARMTGEPKAQ